MSDPSNSKELPKLTPSTPRTPHTPLPSSAFTTPAKFKDTLDRMTQQAQTNTLNTIEESEINPEHKDNPIDEHTNVPEHAAVTDAETLKQQFDVHVLRMQTQMQYLQQQLQQAQSANAYLQYQQQKQYQYPPGQATASPSSYIGSIGKPEYFTGDYKSNPAAWLEQVEDYMGMIGTPSNQYSQFAISYLREQARVWYSSWSAEEKVRNSDWYQFKETLLMRFRPVDAARTARIQLTTLKQTNSVASYNTAFTQCHPIDP